MNYAEQIMRAEINQKVLLPYPYDEVIFDYTNGLGYSWMAGSGFPHIFPMKNSRDVKFFRTLTGAKRNLIRKAKWLQETK